MIKGSVHQDLILNVYVPNHTASKCRQHKLIELQGETDESSIIVVYGSSRQKISKDKIELTRITEHNSEILQVLFQPTTIKQVTSWFFCFPVHIEVIFTL